MTIDNIKSFISGCMFGATCLFTYYVYDNYNCSIISVKRSKEPITIHIHDLNLSITTSNLSDKDKDFMVKNNIEYIEGKIYTKRYYDTDIISIKKAY